MFKPEIMLRSLIEGSSVIYIASRVFDFAEKIKAEETEASVERGIRRAIRDVGLVPQQGASFTFVPFRDTVQSGEVSSTQDLTQKIYDEDVKRLHKLFAFVSFFDGLSKDEGICIELGYAFGIRKPTLLVVTDFVQSEFKGVTESTHLLDPVIEAMASTIIHDYKISETAGTFKDKLQASLQSVLAKLEAAIWSIAVDGAQLPDVPEPDKRHDVCIDFGGGQFEWQRILQQQLFDELRLRGFSCTVCDRYCCLANAGGVRVKQLGLRDIQMAESSRLVVTCSDSLEMSSGTAAIQGFSRAKSKKIVLYDSKATNIVADGSYRSSRNLMVDFSADMVVHSFKQIPRAVELLLR